MKAVGARLPRYDGVGHVTGRTQFVDDVRVGQTLVGEGAPLAARTTPRSRALDTSKAEALKGVHAIVTHGDVPRNVYGHLEGLGVPADEPLLAEGDVRYQGQPIAAVAAETEEAALAAVEAIEIELRGAPGALRHPHWRSTRRRRRSTSGATSIRTTGPYNHRRVRKGDVDWAFERADTIVEGVYRPQAIEQMPLETQVALAVPEAERPPDDLLVHAGDVLLDGRRRRAPAAAAEQAEVRRRHGRRRLRRQGRHRDRDDLRAARAEGRAGRSSGAGRARRSSSPRPRARRGTWRSPTPSRRTAGSSAGGC